jgi:transposase
MAEIILSGKERTNLEYVVAHAHDSRVLQRAYALLWLDDGESATEVAIRLGVSRQSIYNWIDLFHARLDQEIASRLSDAARSGRPRTAHGIIDPLIDAVIESDPRDFGYRSTVWTAPLLVDYLADKHNLVISDDSVRLAIARLKVRWKRPRHRLALRPLTWRQSKGG